MADKYPWYEMVQGSELQQGDLIFGCPVFEPVWKENEGLPKDASREAIVSSMKGEAWFYDVIVLTQSCDLEQNKVKRVVVCTQQAFSHF
jgi:hypothetical protein